MVQLLVNGKLENVIDRFDFARLVRQELGSDAGDYMQGLETDIQDEAVENIHKNAMKYCTGECDHVFRVQEHFENVISEALEALEECFEEVDKTRKPGAAPSKRQQEMEKKLQAVYRILNNNK